MTDLEKRIKRESREWWLKDSNYSKLLDLERLIMKFVKNETDLLSQHIVELQKDKGRLTDENKQAKEIIKELLSKEMHNPFEVLKIRDKAEQFISEVGK